MNAILLCIDLQKGEMKWLSKKQQTRLLDETNRAKRKMLKLGVETIDVAIIPDPDFLSVIGPFSTVNETVREKTGFDLLTHKKTAFLQPPAPDALVLTKKPSPLLTSPCRCIAHRKKLMSFFFVAYKKVIPNTQMRPV